MPKYVGKYFGPSTPAPKFLTQMSKLFIIKFCLIIKVNTICSVGQDTRNPSHKFNSQASALRILGVKVASPKSQGPSSRVLGVRTPCPRVLVPVSRVSGSRVPVSQSPKVSDPRSRDQSPRSRVSGSRISDLRFLGPGSQGLESRISSS